MALSDRRYMRDEYHSTHLTTKLIFVLIGAFVLQSLLLFYGDINVSDEFALSVAGIRAGKIWQLFTFQFLHMCPWPFHVLFNCLGLYFFGRPVEETLGPRRFLRLYLLSGFVGGLLQVVLTVLLPRHPDFPVVGASAGVCGLIAVFCSLYPMQELTTWIYFLPINIRARYLLIFLGCFSAFGSLVPLGAIAHAAHLGGILFGISYVKWRHTFWAGIVDWEPFANHERQGGLVGRLRGRPWRAGTAAPEEEDRDFISKEVDPILDKIAAHGLHSLTDKERKTLEAARKKMRS